MTDVRRRSFYSKNPRVASFKTFGPAHSRWCAQYLLRLHLVGLPGIEPGSHAPHACILPLYYSPLNSFQLYTTVHKTKTSDKCRGFFSSAIELKTTVS